MRLLAPLLALSLACAPLGPAVGQSVPLHSDLVKARAALSGGQPDTAGALARRVLERNPADGEAALLLGLALEAQGRNLEAVAALASAARIDSGSGPAALPARSALARLLPAAFPDQLAPDLQTVLPGARPAGAVGTAAFQVVAPDRLLPAPVTDPKYGWRFSRRAAVYIGDTRHYSIYYQQSQDLPLAARVAELLGRLNAAASLFAAPSRRAEVRVWLPRAGRAGGEQYRDSIYLFAVDVARSDAEWVREVSHELGHIVLPSIAHFEAPEPMENGYLGERLLPKCLFDLGERTLWDGRVLLADYVRDRAVPLRSRYLDAGPAASLRIDRGPAGMDYAIGMVLAFEAQHGPAFLARVFARTTGEGLESLLLAYREEVALLDHYQIPPDLLVARRSLSSGKLQGRLRFRRAVYRAYLPSGRWQITVRGERLNGLRMSVDDRRLGTGRVADGAARFTLAADVSRWHLIELQTAGAEASLTEMNLVPAARYQDSRNAAPPGRN